MAIDKLQKQIINEFSGDNVQKKYIQMAEDDGLWEAEEKLIKKYFTKKGATIIDLGCGTGRTTIPLVNQKFEVIGVDLTPKMIENAKKIAKKKKLKINYQVGDAAHLDFNDNTFDYALFSNQGWTQIPGVEKRKKALKEVRRVLKRNGIYIFTFHPRLWFTRYFFFWIWKSFKFYIIRNIGFKIEEETFGDRFFDRESSNFYDKEEKRYIHARYKTKQYIHIPSIKEVKKQVTETGFQILYLGNGLKSKSKIKSIFVVCKK